MCVWVGVFVICHYWKVESSKSHLSLQYTCASINLILSIQQSKKGPDSVPEKNEIWEGPFFSPPCGLWTRYLLKTNMNIYHGHLSYLKETYCPSFFVGDPSDPISEKVIRWKDIIGPIFLLLSHSAKPLLAQSLKNRLRAHCREKRWLLRKGLRSLLWNGKVICGNPAGSRSLTGIWGSRHSETKWMQWSLSL